MSVGVTACDGRSDTGLVLAERPTRLFYPQLFRRAQREVPEPPVVLEEVTAHIGQPVVEEVPARGPTRRSCPQREAGQTTMGRQRRPPSGSSVDGPCSALSALFPSGTRTLVAAPPPTAVPSWGSRPVVPPILLAPSELLVPTSVGTGWMEVLADLHGTVPFGLKFA